MEEYVREIGLDNEVPEAASFLSEEANDENRDELTFGEFLRRERVLRGISREEILQVTKVTPEYYDHLESNRFDCLPQKAFVVGFLRVLSDYAGLDSGELINRYLSDSGARDPELPRCAAKSFLSRYRGKILFGLGAFTFLALMVVPMFRS